MIRVNLMYKQKRPGEGNAERILRLLRSRSSQARTIAPTEYNEWLVDNGIQIVPQEDNLDYYFLFAAEEDAIAFKLKFGL